MLRSTTRERNLLDLNFARYKLLEAGKVFGAVSKSLSRVDLPIQYRVCFFLL